MFRVAFVVLLAIALGQEQSPEDNTISRNSSVQTRYTVNGNNCQFPAVYRGNVYNDCFDIAGSETCLIRGGSFEECVPVGTQPPSLSNTKNPALLNCNDVPTILQIGSSTVFPVAQRHAQDYANPMVHPQALSTGSTLGFQNFLAGGSDIAIASRPLRGKDFTNSDCDAAGVVDNKAIAECQGRLPVGVRVGIDELAVVVNIDSYFFPENITFDDVKTLFEPSISNATFLTDLFPNAGMPYDIPQIYIPDAKSGTRDFFEEVTEIDFAGVEGYVSDEALIEALLANQQLVGVGVVPLAFAVKAKGIRILNIDGIDPRDVSQVGLYPMARYLFKYYDAAPGADNQAVLDYICALLSVEGQLGVTNRGYVALSQAEVAYGRQLLLCDDRFGSATRVDLTGVMADAAMCRSTKRLFLIGSSTVYPISVEIARLYPVRNIVIDARSTGSTIGILDLIAGAVPIAAASRSIRGKDYAAFDCDETAIEGNSRNRIATAPCQGVEPKGVIIGYDMLSVIVALKSPVGSLTTADLIALFVDKADWNEVGVDLPGAPTLYFPDANSGTHGFFEEVVGEINDQGYVNDYDIVANVATDPNAIGFLGVAYASRAGLRNSGPLDPRLVRLAIDLGLYASDATIIKTVEIDGVSPLDFDKASNYTLARPLFYYYNEASRVENSGDVNDLLCWVLGETGQKIVESAGYVSLASDFPEVLEAEQAQLFC